MIGEELLVKGQKAKEAAYKLSNISTEIKNHALIAMAEALVEKKADILAANAIDIQKGEEKGLTKALLDRLLLTENRIVDMADGLRAIATLADPIGEVTGMWNAAQGIQVGKRRVPLGVVGMIYEARPNVTVDAAGLCLKTGNAIILRGGSEAFNSNMAIAKVIATAAEANQIPVGTIQLIETTDREVVNQMLKLNEFIDVLIPRGGAGLIQTVVKNATVPVIETGVGNCHVYVDNDADLEMAKDIVVNAKTHRPGVCNALETLLVHEEVKQKFLPLVAKYLEEKGVQLRGCPKTLEILPDIQQATEEDWHTEYLDLILAVKVVRDLDEALAHIYKYGTKHSEAIVTENYTKSQRFLQEVDAAAVYVNASTRFTDGFQFGYGAEIGISTQKLHARGPMGLQELTTIKYIVYGEGQIRK